MDLVMLFDLLTEEGTYKASLEAPLAFIFCFPCSIVLAK